jgi:hypothetical protein
VYRLPEECRVPPKHAAVNKDCIVVYTGSAFVGFIREQCEDTNFKPAGIALL